VITLNCYPVKAEQTML